MKTFCGVCIVLRQSICRFSTSIWTFPWNSLDWDHPSQVHVSSYHFPFPSHPAFYEGTSLTQHLSYSGALLWVNLKGQLAKELFGIDMWEPSYNEGIPAWLPLTTMLLYLFKLGARNRTFGPLPHAKKLHNIFRAEKIICSWVFTLHDGF